MERNKLVTQINKEWDIVVIGGGITGAGIFCEAIKQGYSVLLLEQKDFGWGTSSRSAKLVHGGLRYLAQGQIGMTWHCVKEREKLLRDYPNLIEPLKFLYPAYKKDFMSSLTGVGLTVYDLMAGRKDYQYHSKDSFEMEAPSLSIKNLKGGYSFTDASVDDARLVMRVIKEGQEYGGTAINYMQVNNLFIGSNGEINSVSVVDKISEKEMVVKAKIVINATGIFADSIRGKLNKKPILRMLKGSHIIFPKSRFPLTKAISFNHPDDKRPLYAMPWEGATLYGTTDLESKSDIFEEPKINKDESAYLFRALDIFFPKLALTKEDAISTFSGVRPVINTGKENPSKESREHIILNDNGLITVTGGKLTTFRIIAKDAIKEVSKNISPSMSQKALPDGASDVKLDINKDSNEYKRLERTFGREANIICKSEKYMSKGYIERTNILWAELVWSIEKEQVNHLEDLLLRRTRLGLISDEGCAYILDKIGHILIEEFDYSSSQFDNEKKQYLKLWNEAYSPQLL